MIKIDTLAFDLDGTLLNSNKQISRNTKEILKLLNDSYNIILISGRYYNEIVSYAEEVSGSKGCYIICRDGISIFSPDGKLLHKESEFNCNEVFELFTKADEYNIALYSNSVDYYYYAKIRERIKAIIRSLAYKGKKQRIIGRIDNRCIPDGVDKILISNMVSQNVKSELCKTYSLHKTSDNKIEVLPKGVNKYNALKWLEKEKLIEMSRLLYFGDYYNDEECFNNLKYTVAMGNACEEIKKKAFFITLNNDEDGIVFAIDHLIRGNV